MSFLIRAVRNGHDGRRVLSIRVRDEESRVRLQSPEPRVGADPYDEAGATVTVYGAQHVCLPPLTHGGEPGTRVLEYGEVIRVGDIACRSEVTGMSCTYGPRGFFLSRDKVVVF